MSEHLEQVVWKSRESFGVSPTISLLLQKKTNTYNVTFV